MVTAAAADAVTASTATRTYQLSAVLSCPLPSTARAKPLGRGVAVGKLQHLKGTRQQARVATAPSTCTIHMAKPPGRTFGIMLGIMRSSSADCLRRAIRPPYGAKRARTGASQVRIGQLVSRWSKSRELAALRLGSVQVSCSVPLDTERRDANSRSVLVVAHGPAERWHACYTLCNSSVEVDTESSCAGALGTGGVRVAVGIRAHKARGTFALLRRVLAGGVCAFITHKRYCTHYTSSSNTSIRPPVRSAAHSRFFRILYAIYDIQVSSKSKYSTKAPYTSPSDQKMLSVL